MLCTSLIFLPYYVCSLLGVRVREFVSQAYALPCDLRTAVVVLLLMRQLFTRTDYDPTAGPALGGRHGLCCGLAVLLLTRDPMGVKLRTGSQRTCISPWAIDVTDNSPREEARRRCHR